ncbi:MAG TPA: PIG-L deacetylase family protein [Acidimicrobiales bacterium]|jgi:LmbE family N-acetylglucosaminyl deacetylase
MNFRDLKVVAIGAHPDDVEYGCYTVLSRCYEPVMVNLTRGEHGGEHNIREKESRATAELLNARLIQLTLEDTNINLREAATALEKIIRDERPDVVLTMTEPDLHQDHVTVAKATTIALREYEGLVLGYQTPSNIVTFQPDIYFEISNDEFLAKMQALRVHATQSNRRYLGEDALRSVSRFWATATRTEFEYVEAFKILRWVVPLSER